VGAEPSTQWQTRDEAAPYTRRIWQCLNQGIPVDLVLAEPICIYSYSLSSHTVVEVPDIVEVQVDYVQDYVDFQCGVYQKSRHEYIELHQLKRDHNELQLVRWQLQRDYDALLRGCSHLELQQGIQLQVGHNSWEKSMKWRKKDPKWKEAFNALEGAGVVLEGESKMNVAGLIVGKNQVISRVKNAAEKMKVNSNKEMRDLKETVRDMRKKFVVKNAKSNSSLASVSTLLDESGADPVDLRDHMRMFRHNITHIHDDLMARGKKRKVDCTDEIKKKLVTVRQCAFDATIRIIKQRTGNVDEDDLKQWSDFFSSLSNGECTAVHSLMVHLGHLNSITRQGGSILGKQKNMGDKIVEAISMCLGESASVCKIEDIRGDYNAYRMMHYVDRKLVSMACINALRQMSGYKLMPSTYSIRQHRAAADAVMTYLIDAEVTTETSFTMNPDKVFKLLLERLLENKEIEEGEVEIMTVEGEETVRKKPIQVTMTLTFDGTRMGSRTMSFGGFKILGSQSRDDSIITTAFIGADNGANCLYHFGHLFKWAESINNEIIEVNGISYEVLINNCLDVKAQWEITQSGCPATCQFCSMKKNDSLAAKPKTQKFPCVNGCPQSLNCRCQRMSKFLPDFCKETNQRLGGVQLQTTLEVDLLTATLTKQKEYFAKIKANVNCPVAIPYIVDPTANGAAHSNGIDKWIKRFHVSPTSYSIYNYSDMVVGKEKELTCHVGQDTNNFALTCAIEKINIQLQVRYGENLNDRLVEFKLKYFEDRVDDNIDGDIRRQLLIWVFQMEEMQRGQDAKIISHGKTNTISDNRDMMLCVVHLRLRTEERVIRYLVQDCALKIWKKCQVEGKVAELTKALSATAYGISSTGKEVTIQVVNGKLLKLNVPGDKLHKAIKNYQPLLDIVFGDDDPKKVYTNTGGNRANWENYFQQYISIVHTICQDKINLNQEELTNLQRGIEQFGNLWIQMLPTTNIGNYFHYIFAGHVVEMMAKWGNLAQYSNQGWEALNGYMKSAIHRISQRDGSANKGRSRLIQFIRSICLRRLGYRLDGNINEAKSEGWFAKNIAMQLTVDRAKRREEKKKGQEQAGEDNPIDNVDWEPDIMRETAQAVNTGLVEFLLEGDNK
jgi:hypothetical protein